ncbi:uncharacterized protein TNCV_1534431 [Trichonephila clavipes]|nr:uncharacterized protein TNCV_1534431 [Trichonephila clavipes]
MVHILGEAGMNLRRWATNSTTLHEAWKRANIDYRKTSKESVALSSLLNYLRTFGDGPVAAVAEWYRYRTVACFVTGSSPVPLKTRRVGQRCTLNLSRAETSSRWCGVVVRRGGASSGVVHVT